MTAEELAELEAAVDAADAKAVEAWQRWKAAAAESNRVWDRWVAAERVWRQEASNEHPT